MRNQMGLKYGKVKSVFYPTVCEHAQEDNNHGKRIACFQIGHYNALFENKHFLFSLNNFVWKDNFLFIYFFFSIIPLLIFEAF